MTDNKQKLWNKHFIMACAVILLSGFAMNMMNSTMAKYIYSVYGNASFSGILNGAFAVMAVLARLVSGDLSDRRGRGLVILLGSTIFAVGVFGFGIFPWAAALVLFRSLQGLGYATTSTGAYAAGSDSLPKSRMSEGIGYLGLGYSLAMAIGPAIALNLIVGENYIPVFLVAGIMLLISAVVGWMYRRKAEAGFCPTTERGKLTLGRFVEKKALPAATVQLFNCLAQAAINSYIVIFAESRGITGTAYFFTFMAVAMCLTRLCSGRIGDRFGFRSVVIPAIVMNILGFAILMIYSSTGAFYIAGFLLGIGQGIFGPAMQTVAVQASPDNRKGAANSTFQIANDLSNGLGAVIWGVVIDFMGYNAMLGGCIAAAAVSFVLLMTIIPRAKHQVNTTN